MATLKLSVLKNKPLVDGRYKIRVAVCHKQQTCYIVTRFAIDNLSQFKNGLVVKRSDASIINSKLRKLLDRYQEKLDNIDTINAYTCKQITAILNRTTIIADDFLFSDIASEYITALRKEGRVKYAQSISWSCEHFIRYLHTDIPIRDIDITLIAGFSTYARLKTELSITSINMVLSRIKVIINYAIMTRRVRYDVHPFATTKIKKALPRRVSISVTTLRIIRDAVFNKRSLTIARDLFMLSFYTGGTNLIDLMSINFSGRKICFTRQKTASRQFNAEQTVLPITNEAYNIIYKYIDKQGKLSLGYNFSYHNLNNYIGKAIREIATLLGISERLVFYSARKTFAEVALEIGIPDPITNYCMGHSNSNRGVISYYSRVTEEQAAKAIQAVTDYIR